LPPKYQNRRSPPANAQLTLQDPILPRKRDEVTGIIKLYQSLHEHIDINNVNQPFMRLFEQIQALQIIPFKDKVIDTVCGCGDFLIRVFREM
jgi:hypothetical protein